MQDLKITVIQADLVWEDIEANLAGFDKRLDAIDGETHLIVLPEMFTTGFSMNPVALAQDMSGAAVNWMLEKSRQKKVDLVGSIIVKEHNKYFNRLVWAKPNGGMSTYDKKHLFRMAGEEKVYSPGHKNITVELNGWKIRPFICYDLRFPVWTRNIDNQYDLAVFVANWPARRAGHWKLLLQSRAVENQCFVVGVNRVGTDGNGHPYSGDSSIIDPWGNILFLRSNLECSYTAALSYDVLQSCREAFPFWMDADHDLIRLQ